MLHTWLLQPRDKTFTGSARLQCLHGLLPICVPFLDGGLELFRAIEIRRYRHNPRITGSVPVPSHLNSSKPSSRKSAVREYSFDASEL